MTIQKPAPPRGYLKGMSRRRYREMFVIDQDVAHRSESTGRAIVQTKPVDIKKVIEYYELGIPIHMSDVTPVGKPFFVDYAILTYHFGVYLNPTDYYWFKHRNNPDLAHRLYESWFDQRLETLEREANERLDAMVLAYEMADKRRLTMDRWLEEVLNPVEAYIFNPNEKIKYRHNDGIVSEIHYVGYPDDWDRLHPHKVEHKTVSFAGGPE